MEGDRAVERSFDVVRISRRGLILGCLAAASCRTKPRETVGDQAPPSASAISSAAPDSSTVAVGEPVRVSPLEARYPELARRLPRVHLARFPSRLESFASFGEALGAKHLFVKRDDVASVNFGGGKARKLELLLGEAMAAKYETVVTFGGAGSNQAVATARFGAKLGLRVVLYLAPQVRGPHVRKAIFAMQRAGAELRYTPSVSEAEAEVARAVKHGERMYVIGPGASSPRGDLAFVEAGIELADDLRAAKITEPLAVYIACGTGGSAAGLTVGLRAAGSNARVVAVRASSPGTSSRARLDALASAVVAEARALDPSFPTIAPADVALTIDGSELGGGYGHPTADGAEMIARAAAFDLHFEPVYTAKAMAALALQAAKRRGESFVFWATQHGGELGDEGDLATLSAPIRSLARL